MVGSLLPVPFTGTGSPGLAKQASPALETDLIFGRPSFGRVLSVHPFDRVYDGS